MGATRGARKVGGLGAFLIDDADVPFPEQEASEAAAVAQKVRTFLEVKAGSSLRAWLRYFDKNYDKRVRKHEFYYGLTDLGIEDDVPTLFAALDVDGSGELTLDEIDAVQGALWERFIQWCVLHFISSSDMVQRLAGSPRAEELLFAQFQDGLVSIGWDGGCEELIFSALDVEANGQLTIEELKWLDIERTRQIRKMTAKQRSSQENAWRDRRKKKAQNLTREFRAYLVRKHGSYLRAWRVALSPNDAMTLNKNQFMKACAKMGWQANSTLVWQTLDSDDSGTLALEKLDLRSAELLASFRKFIIDRFGSVAAAFEAIDTNHSNSVQFLDFAAALQSLGWKRSHKQLFMGLDKNDSKSITEDDMTFLDRWRPHAMLLATPNVQALNKIKAVLLEKFGSYLKAWRRLLDKDGTNRCNWNEFQAACEAIRFSGDRVGAWRAADKDLSGYITLSEIDMVAHEHLLRFKRWADEEFGSARNAFKTFDVDSSDEVTSQEFCRSCRIYGYAGKPFPLFKALDADLQGTLSNAEVAFLDDWDLEESEQGDHTVQSTSKTRSQLQLQLQFPQQQQPQQRQQQQRQQQQRQRQRRSHRAKRHNVDMALATPQGNTSSRRSGTVVGFAEENLCSLPPSFRLLERPRIGSLSPRSLDAGAQLLVRPFPQIDNSWKLERPLTMPAGSWNGASMERYTPAPATSTPRTRARCLGAALMGSPYRPLSARRTPSSSKRAAPGTTTLET